MLTDRHIGQVQLPVTLKDCGDGFYVIIDATGLKVIEVGQMRFEEAGKFAAHVVRLLNDALTPDEALEVY